MPGPHDFAVRSNLCQTLRPAMCNRRSFGEGVEAPFVRAVAHRSQTEARPAIADCANAAASTASHPAFVTTRDRPSEGRDGGAFRFDLGRSERKMFLQTRLDRANHLETIAKNRTIRRIKADAVKFYGPNGVWKNVGQLLDQTYSGRRSSIRKVGPDATADASCCDVQPQQARSGEPCGSQSLSRLTTQREGRCPDRLVPSINDPGGQSRECPTFIETTAIACGRCSDGATGRPRRCESIKQGTGLDGAA
jgi:hypothetical protein